MEFHNPFKRKSVNDETAKINQKILDNVMNLINDETKKNMKIITEKAQGHQIAKLKIDFIREIYKKMNEK